MLQGLTVPAAPPTFTNDMAIQWEEVRSSGALLAVHRARVPGGWLVYASNGYHHHGGITFYPDPSHSWASYPEL